MTPTSEAACLLRSGAMYPGRVGLLGKTGEVVFAGIKPGGFSLYFGDAPIYHLDFEGRWQRAFVGSVHYLKGLDATVRAVDRVREGGSLILRRRTLDPAEAVDLDATIRRAAVGLIGDLEAARAEILVPPPTARAIGSEELRELLGRVAAWDAAAWEAHRARYEESYEPWPLLPPDCPNPVVLQATLGPGFGGGGPPTSRVRPPAEFAEHAQAVARLLGRRLGQCRDLFVAGGDWLRRPLVELVDALGVIDRTFPDPARPGGPESGRSHVVHAFLDDFRPPLPGLDGWRRLRASRLGRITLGIESGDPAVRGLFGKSWEERDLHSTVEAIKAAGIGLGLMVLVGAGGRSGAGAHLDATARLVGSLGLGAGDLVALVDDRGLGTPAVAGKALSDDEAAGWSDDLKRRLASAGPSNRPRVVAYNPAKQWA